MAVATRELTCINCPLGCQVTVTLETGSEGASPHEVSRILSVTGNSCPRGEKYARTEVTDPRRTVTTSVPVVGSATERMVSVKTESGIPKGKMQACVQAIHAVVAQAPVRIGDVVLPNVCNTGVNVVATRNA